MVTYDAPVTFHMNGEDVRLIPIPAAHTDGDTMVYFPKADVIMSGDFYRSPEALLLPDTEIPTRLAETVLSRIVPVSAKL